MPRETQMASMDLDSIIESEIGTQNTEVEPDSAGDTQPSEEPATPPAPGGTGEQQNGDTPAGEPSTEPETGSEEPKGGQRRPYSRLEKAEYSATKWKRKAKKTQEAYDKLLAEFNRYKDLNPAAFRNPEERMQFMAWRASTAQRLDDMGADLDEIAQGEVEDAYEEKIAQCYSRPEAVEGFRQLDDHYNGALEYMCRQVDPDGVILDFLRDSPYEPAMRNVIYKNGDLQEELFRAYRNPTIGNAKRTQILQRLENQVAAFLNRQQPAKAQQKAQPSPVQEDPAKAPQQVAPRKPRFQLPLRKEEPRPAPAKPQVTGSLTRQDAGGSEPDTSAQADQMYKQLFGAGA